MKTTTKITDQIRGGTNEATLGEISRQIPERILVGIAEGIHSGTLEETPGKKSEGISGVIAKCVPGGIPKKFLPGVPKKIPEKHPWEVMENF